MRGTAPIAGTAGLATVDTMGRAAPAYGVPRRMVAGTTATGGPRSGGMGGTPSPPEGPERQYARPPAGPSADSPSGSHGPRAQAFDPAGHPFAAMAPGPHGL
jgi:hypothetical protein